MCGSWTFAEVFQILASEKTGAIEESDFLLGCLRLRGGATAVDMVRIQMEQEWIHSAILQMKASMQKTLKDLAQLHFLFSEKLRREDGAEKDVDFEPGRHSEARWKSEGSKSSSESSVEVLHHYQRTTLNASERAVTVEELKGILHELPQVCHGWKDSYTGEAISVSTLNLYHFNYHYIMPKTAPQEGILLQWPASALNSSILPKEGQGISQRCESMALPRAKAVVLCAEVTSDGPENTEVLKIWIRLLRGLDETRARIIHATAGVF